jgi:hypothetical protein
MFAFRSRPMLVSALSLLALVQSLDLHRARLPVLAYCTEPGCPICRAGNQRTATGTDPAKPGLAVHPDCGIPLGARVAVPGIGWLTADDVSTAPYPCVEWRTGSAPGSHKRAADHGAPVLEIFWRAGK